MLARAATIRPSSTRQLPLLAAALAAALLAPPDRPRAAEAAVVLFDLEHDGLVSHLSQRDYRWRSVAIGPEPICEEGYTPAGTGAGVQLYRCADRPGSIRPGFHDPDDGVIETWGCVLTSISMIADRYNLLPSVPVPVPDWDPVFWVSPVYVHARLMMDGKAGYDPAADRLMMRFARQPLRAAFSGADSLAPVGLRLVERAWPGARKELDEALKDSLQPFILNVDMENGVDHAFLAVGRTTDDYLVLDPDVLSDALHPGARADTLAHARGVSLEKVAGLVKSAFQVTPSDPRSASWLEADVHSPVELLLVAPDGRRTGRDPARGVSVEEIPDSAYVRRVPWPGSPSADQPRTVSVESPARGTWTLLLLATGDGPFRLEVAGESPAGAGLWQELSGTVQAGEVRRFTIHHDPAAAEPFAFAEGATIPPVADAGAGRAVFAAAAVPFDGSRSRDPDGTIASWAWDFGDGASGSGATPSHAYASPGLYTATLTVTDDQGATASDTVVVSVFPAASASTPGATVAVDQMPGTTSLAGDWPYVGGDYPAMSGDGTVIAFTATHNASAVWLEVRDRAAGTTTLIGQGRFPTISRDGRWVAYQRDSMVWVYDRQSGTEARGDLAPDGQPANAGSWAPILSGDGRHLLFVSDATNLVPARPPGLYGHLYLRDLDTGTIVHVNEASLNAPYCGCDLRSDLAVSDDGGAVAYNARDPADGGRFLPAVWTRATGQTTRSPVGVSPFGGIALSGDGRFLAVAGNTGLGYEDVVVVELATSAQDPACVSSLGAHAEGTCRRPVLSQDGRFVAFASGAANLVPGDVHSTNGFQDAFVRDRLLGTTELATLTSAGAQATPVPGVGSSRMVGGVCDDGRCVCFATRAAMVPGDSNEALDVYLRLLGTAPEPSPPLAAAGGPYHGWAGLPVAFDAARSSAPDGAPLTATWDFGDSTPPASGPAADPVAHAYAAAGRYTATLTVTDGTRTSTAAQAEVEVLAAPPSAGPGALSLHPACGDPGATVTLLLERRPVTASSSWDEAAQGAPGSLLDGAPPSSLALSLAGPGGDLGTTDAAITSLVRTAPLEYSALAAWGVPAGFGPGTYTLSAEGATATFEVPCPVPAWLAREPVSAPGGPYQGTAGAPVAFDGTGSTDPRGLALTYAWDFGDGTTGAGAHVDHAYAEPGVYEVTLTVSNGELVSSCGIMGRCATTASIAAAVEPPPAEPGTGDTGGCGCGTGGPDAGWLALLAAALAWPRRARRAPPRPG